jgi:hypothetical protein
MGISCSLVTWEASQESCLSNKTPYIWIMLLTFPNVFSFNLILCSQVVKNLNIFSFDYFFYCCAGVHCGIYKSSYNISSISYSNSFPQLFSFISSSPYSWNSFNRSHFSIYIHVYRVFAPCSPFYTFSLHIPFSHWYQPSRQDPFCPPVEYMYFFTHWKLVSLAFSSF